jgi:hypothetical protein
VRRECRLTYRVTRSPTSRTVFSKDTYPSTARLCWMLVTRRGLSWPSVERLSRTSSRSALSLVFPEIADMTVTAYVPAPALARVRPWEPLVGSLHPSGKTF